MLTLNKVIKLLSKVKSSTCCEERNISLGNTVYYPLWWAGLVVEARVEELQFVLGKPGNDSVWLYLDKGLYKPKGYYCSAPKVPEEKNKLGWVITEEIGPEEILLDPETVVFSWGAWLDLPIGHAVWPETDMFLDPSVPLSFMAPKKFRRRQRKSILNSFIRNGMKSLANSHRKTVEEMNFPKYRTFKDRKTYWRRK